MVPFNLQFELNGKVTTFSIEQLDPLADAEGYMRYLVRTFNQRSEVYVYVDKEPLAAEEGDSYGFNLDDGFSNAEVKVIAAEIIRYNDSRKLNFDQMAFDF